MTLCLFLCFLSKDISCAIPPKASVVRSIKKICQKIPGEFGIAALHIDSGRSLEINSRRRFPMASTYKIPIGAYCFALIDQKKIRYQRKKRITKNDMRRFCFVSPGQTLSVKKLLKLMLEKSDNATSDIVLKMVGGGKAVTRWLRKHKIHGIRVDRSTLKMCSDYSTSARFCVDKRDTTTPRSMVAFLKLLFTGKLISKSSTNCLLSHMKNCSAWGKKRIPRLLPKKTIVYHKTGSMDGIISDAGIIKLPGKKGHIALAIYTNKSTGHMRKKEAAIARIAKKIFDHFSHA